jgi:hypothetical protein
VLVGGRMVDSVREAHVFEAGVVAASDDGAVIVPWHMVRWAEVESDGADPLKKPVSLNPNAHPPSEFVTVPKRRKKSETPGA